VIALTRAHETSLKLEGSGLARRTAAVAALVGVAFWATGAPEDKKEEKNTGRIAISGGIDFPTDYYTTDQVQGPPDARSSRSSPRLPIPRSPRIGDDSDVYSWEKRSPDYTRSGGQVARNRCSCNIFTSWNDA
jgi:hypothetical protein